MAKPESAEAVSHLGDSIIEGLPSRSSNDSKILYHSSTGKATFTLVNFHIVPLDLYIPMI